MEITEGVKIELNSIDVENIVEQWAVDKLNSIGCQLTRTKVEAVFPNVVIHGVKSKAAN